LIVLSNISKAHGAAALFRDVSLQLLPGRRIALIGANGAGKTTLLEIALGLQEPDAGEVARAKDVRVGYLPQDLTETATGTVLEETLLGADELHRIERRLAELHDDLEDPAKLDEYGHLQERFEHLGGYHVEADAHRILAGLGFEPGDADRPVTELSGGWRMRVALARLMLSRPDVLVLDEPTNHLDVDSIAWLEETLAAYEGAILFVSHDRDFIDAVAERVVELAGRTATEYVGGFAEFVVQREERLASANAAKAQQDRYLAQQERFIERFRYKASKAKAVQSRIKALERVERVVVPDLKTRTAAFAFPDPPRSGRVVVEFDGVDVGYDEPLLTGMDLVVERGEKIGVIGPNGAGKTTLLRLLTGELQPMAGTVTLGHNVQVAVFAQHQVDVLRAELTVLEEFASGLSERHRGTNLRTRLGAFGFSGDAADRKVAVLSGGEKTRLALAKVMADPVNLLILDEPTNHLDIPSRDVLEDALLAYPGTVLLVTHDRHVIRNVAANILDVRDGRITRFDGSFDEWVAARDQVPDAPRRLAASTTGPAASDRDERSERKRRDAELRNAMHRATADLRRAVQRLERQVADAEAEVADLNRRLADPAVYGDPHERAT
jgi:ATP-binding cassette, subfamily F, member 3